MSVELAYDASYEPPAPVVPIAISAPGSDVVALRVALVDSGADCTIVPRSVARALALPEVDRVDVIGAAGGMLSVPRYAARVRLGSWTALIDVLGLGDDALIGRDILARLVVTLDGPRGALRVRGTERRRR